jgi:hypothetical protein
MTEAGVDLEAARATAEAIVRQATSDLGKSSIDAVAADYAEHLGALAESLNVLGTLAMRAGGSPTPRATTGRPTRSSPARPRRGVSPRC